MLDCETMQRVLHPYLDGELTARDAVDIQDHLDNCSACAALYRNEHLFLDLFQHSVPHQPAPPGLESKVNQALNALTQRRRPSSPLWRLVAPSLAVSLIALVTLLVVGKKALPEFVDVAVNTHQMYLADNTQLDIQSHDVSVVSRWIRQQSGLSVSPIQEPVKNLQLVGGRLVPFRKKSAVFLVYEISGRPVSLLITTAEGVKVSGERVLIEKQIPFYQSSYHALQTLSWALDGLAYVVVSDTQELNKQACQICHISRERFDSSPSSGPTLHGSDRSSLKTLDPIAL
jgi:anti-sigma factor (TIGR02949 family)